MTGRILGAGVFLWCLLVETAEVFARRNFGFELDGDWFLLLAISDSQEISRFVSLYAGSLAVCLLSMTTVAVIGCWTILRAKGRWLAVLILAFAGYVTAQSYAWGSFKRWKPVYVAYDTIRSTREYRELAKAGAWTPDRARASASARAGATNLVFVIGESLTTARLERYGYGKPTTPRLKALGDQIAWLGPLTAAYPDTARALRVLLSEATRKRGSCAAETLPVVLRQRGYRTVLVSAQRHWERYCGVEQMVFAACEKRLYLHELKEGKCFDMDLLPILRREMAASDGRPFALFVHLIGSHFDYSWCVPEGYAANEGLDAYDRTVRYTDEVLSELITALPPQTLFVFVSDHGESPDAGRSRDIGCESMWQVPLLVYPSSLAAAFTDDYDFLFNNLKTLLN